jgi:Ca-activated chloride channel family protein
MEFANPKILWLLLAIPLWVAYYVWRSLQGGASIVISSTDSLRKAPRTLRYYLRHLPAVLRVGVLSLIVVALARPQTIEQNIKTNVEGIDIVLAMDISGSMLARDFKPDRLTAAKEVASQFVVSREGDRIGLVVFAGEAKVQYPIADDYHLARSFTKRISTSLIAEQGTDIEKALRQSILAFSNTEAKNRAIILITDGENHDGDLSEVLEQAQEEGIRIYTIGIGTPEGAPIKIGNSYLKDEQQKMVVSKLGEATLTQIATQTGGIYIRASKQDLGLSDIIKSINQMEKGAVQKHSYSEYTELYMYPLMVAFVLLIVELMILSRRNHRIKRFTLFDKK